jgi:hypothetical protein
MNKKLVIGGVALGAVLVGGSAAIAVAAGGDDEPLTGSTLEQATEAALDHTGGGTVVESELGDGGAAYEVEIRLDDGRIVEVELDESFVVIDQNVDDDGGDGSVEDETSEEDGAADDG